jgi:hypothetical protein
MKDKIDRPKKSIHKIILVALCFFALFMILVNMYFVFLNVHLAFRDEILFLAIAFAIAIAYGAGALIKQR